MSITSDITNCVNNCGPNYHPLDAGVKPTSCSDLKDNYNVKNGYYFIVTDGQNHQPVDAINDMQTTIGYVDIKTSTGVSFNVGRNST